MLQHPKQLIVDRNPVIRSAREGRRQHPPGRIPSMFVSSRQ
ncbi:hypothetical protein HMPREF0063_10873 [Aeromicrobium marinum DSM 15272]|uniref:Uncharacterized protein n=1 Tax=Aeromicrobium marinum DSM 15272 TaxID=585531 RepID=E2SA83_9ACTN|nr:hypothetical protein HMPREF0063_10873 [Aeromicrobium marinum DSM 15272]